MVAKYRPNWQLHGARARVHASCHSGSPVRSLSRSQSWLGSPYPSTESFGGATTLLCFKCSSRGSFWTSSPGNIDFRVFLFCRDHRCECFILLAASLFSLVDQPAAPDESGEVRYLLPRGQSSPATALQDNGRDPKLLKKALNPTQFGSWGYRKFWTN
jgi:hypothetical protein